jgi:hypothetical protein
MPRLLLKSFDSTPDQTAYLAAEAVEAASLSWVVATDPLRSGLALVPRCAVAGAVWVAYSRWVDAM